MVDTVGVFPITCLRFEADDETAPGHFRLALFGVVQLTVRSQRHLASIDTLRYHSQVLHALLLQTVDQFTGFC